MLILLIEKNTLDEYGEIIKSLNELGWCDTNDVNVDRFVWMFGFAEE